MMVKLGNQHVVDESMSISTPGVVSSDAVQSFVVCSVMLDFSPLKKCEWQLDSYSRRSESKCQMMIADGYYGTST